MGTATYDWDGDDLQSRGLFLDMSPWQTAVFSLTKTARNRQSMSRVDVV